MPVTFVPAVWSLDAYREIFERRNFAHYMWNAMVVSLATTLWGVAVAAWSGYGFARYDFRFKAALMAFVLIAQSFPRILLVIPYFEMANRFGLKDTYLGLILAYSTFIQPLCLWIMKEYFEQIPRELDEAALVDGASPYRAFWDIILPLARPALGATAIIGFLTAWNEYEFALVLTSSEKVRTISVAIASLIGEFTTEWNQVMAAAAIGTVPGGDRLPLLPEAVDARADRRSGQGVTGDGVTGDGDRWARTAGGANDRRIVRPHGGGWRRVAELHLRPDRHRRRADRSGRGLAGRAD